MNPAAARHIANTAGQVNQSFNAGPNHRRPSIAATPPSNRANQASSIAATPPSNKGLDMSSSSFQKAAMLSSSKKTGRATPRHPYFRGDNLPRPRNLQDEDHGPKPRTNHLGTAEENGFYFLRAGDNAHLIDFTNTVECELFMSEEFYLEGQLNKADILQKLFADPKKSNILMMGREKSQFAIRESFQRLNELKSILALKEKQLAQYTSDYEMHKKDRAYAEEMLRMAKEAIDNETSEEAWNAQMVEDTQKEIDDAIKTEIGLKKIREVIGAINSSEVCENPHLNWKECSIEIIRDILGLQSKDDVIQKCNTEPLSRGVINMLELHGYGHHPHFLMQDCSGGLATGRASSKKESHIRLCRYLGFEIPTSADYIEEKFHEFAQNPETMEQFLEYYKWVQAEKGDHV